MLRSKLKSAGAATLHFTRVAGGVGRYSGNAKLPLVVGYHRVVESIEAHEDDDVPGMLTSLAMLEQQLDWIGHHFEFCDPDDMDRSLDGRNPGGRPAAVITFDDGYRDVYEHAFPLLRSKGIPAVVFVNTDLVGSNALQLHDELFLLVSESMRNWRAPGKQMHAMLAEAGLEIPASALPSHEDATALQWMRALYCMLPRPALQRIIQVLSRETSVPANIAACLRSMDWNMLARLRAAGIRIGSHTRSHALLTNEGPETLREEIGGSRRVLEERLGSRVWHFAYPDGRFNDAVVAAVAKAGYRFAYTTCRHRDARHPALTIPRRLLWENACVDPTGHFSPAVMDCEVNGVFDYSSRCRQQHAV
ncbi:MAG: polysaccharide deacetylase family protein [Gammaproteobacteria bacterium]|nr:polysaccharide deacetylase family protein [Gammaproteobacteria bacterium]